MPIACVTLERMECSSGEWFKRRWPRRLAMLLCGRWGVHAVMPLAQRALREQGVLRGRGVLAAHQRPEFLARIHAENAPHKELSRMIFRSCGLHLVPRRGLEPPRSYPLVPETSASTNSATWAGTSSLLPFN